VVIKFTVVNILSMEYEEERLGNSVLLCQSLSHDHVKFPPSFQVFINKKNQSNIDVLP
jgi:hypothetical protein